MSMALCVSDSPCCVYLVILPGNETKATSTRTKRILMCDPKPKKNLYPGSHSVLLVLTPPTALLLFSPDICYS